MSWSTEESNSESESIILPRQVSHLLTKRKATTSNATTNMPNNGGRKGLSKNYSHEETMTMLELMQEILPISMEDWQLVEDRLRAKFPPGREVASMRRKYHILHRKKCPTGDPNYPPEVKLARTVQR